MWNHVEWFYAESCRAQKHVQEDKKNKNNSRSELHGGIWRLAQEISLLSTSLKKLRKFSAGHWSAFWESYSATGTILQSSR
jgi:hypothetical protein